MAKYSDRYYELAKQILDKYLIINKQDISLNSNGYMNIENAYRNFDFQKYFRKYLQYYYCNTMHTLTTFKNAIDSSVLKELKIAGVAQDPIITCLIDKKLVEQTEEGLTNILKINDSDTSTVELYLGFSFAPVVTWRNKIIYTNGTNESISIDTAALEEFKTITNGIDIDSPDFCTFINAENIYDERIYNDGTRQIVEVRESQNTFSLLLGASSIYTTNNSNGITWGQIRSLENQGKLVWESNVPLFFKAEDALEFLTTPGGTGLEKSLNINYTPPTPPEPDPTPVQAWRKKFQDYVNVPYAVFEVNSKSEFDMSTLHYSSYSMVDIDESTVEVFGRLDVNKGDYSSDGYPLGVAEKFTFGFNSSLPQKNRINRIACYVHQSSIYDYNDFSVCTIILKPIIYSSEKYTPKNGCVLQRMMMGNDLRYNVDELEKVAGGKVELWDINQNVTYFPYTINKNGMHLDECVVICRRLKETTSSGTKIRPRAMLYTNIPIFLSKEEAIHYYETGKGLENALNYGGMEPFRPGNDPLNSAEEEYAVSGKTLTQISTSCDKIKIDGALHEHTPKTIHDMLYNYLWNCNGEIRETYASDPPGNISIFKEVIEKNNPKNLYLYAEVKYIRIIQNYTIDFIDCCKLYDFNCTGGIPIGCLSLQKFSEMLDVDGTNIGAKDYFFPTLRFISENNNIKCKILRGSGNNAILKTLNCNLNNSNISNFIPLMSGECETKLDHHFHEATDITITTNIPIIYDNKSQYFKNKKIYNRTDIGYKDFKDYPFINDINFNEKDYKILDRNISPQFNMSFMDYSYRLNFPYYVPSVGYVGERTILSARQDTLQNHIVTAHMAYQLRTRKEL